MGSIAIRCRECGKVFSSFREHERHILGDHRESDAARILRMENHAEIRGFYRENPHLIEKGMRIIGEEVYLLRGRVDLVGRDGNRRLVLIDVTKSKELDRKKEQLRKYRKYVRAIGTRLFDVPATDVIRLFIIQAGKEPVEVE